jgi:hypothetical protein
VHAGRHPRSNVGERHLRSGGSKACETNEVMLLGTDKRVNCAKHARVKIVDPGARVGTGFILANEEQVR